ncbi:MAG: cytochrome c-type biogenesis protein CcmH [Proteobacteria bacterium]|nr:cytochrome c-type biogenesis protein CcmH [Pseudomonadota bacterium]
MAGALCAPTNQYVAVRTRSRRRPDTSASPRLRAKPFSSGCLALLLTLLALVFAQPSLAQTSYNAGPEKLSDPALEVRAVQLQKQFRCLVCQGESLDESDAPLAADLRKLIRARIAAGDSDEQVEHYLVARYGEFILMKPPFEPQTYLLWFGPVLVLLIGGVVVFFIARRAQEKAGKSAV